MKRKKVCAIIDGRRFSRLVYVCLLFILIGYHKSLWACPVVDRKCRLKPTSSLQEHMECTQDFLVSAQRACSVSVRHSESCGQYFQT